MAFTTTKAEEMETLVYIGQYKYSVGNGRAWRTFSRESKMTFLKGIDEGFRLLRLQMIEDNKPLAVIEHVMDTTKSLVFATGFQFEELTYQVDDFYSDSANIKTPIIEMFRCINLKLRGSTPSEIQEHLARLRERYNR